MIKFVGGGVALFVLAIVVVVATQSHDLAALVAAFAAEPLLGKLAWAVIVLVPLVLVPSALWLGDALVRQRTAARALELRLDGVRQDVKELAKSQVDAEAAVRQLARSDPEDAIGALQHRLTEAERVAQVQAGRNEIGDLQSRVDQLRARQEGLKGKLAPVLDKRRAIEQLFAELDGRLGDIERALAEVAGGDDALTIDLRLKNLMEFVRHGNARCDEIEAAAKTAAGLKEDYVALRTRLAPFAAAADGVASRLKGLSDAQAGLAADIEALQRTPQGSLAERVQGFAAEKRNLDDGVANLDLQFSKLATLRKDMDVLMAGFGRALDAIAVDGHKGKAAGIDARVEHLAAFVSATQAQVEEVERRLVAFNQLRARLSDLQARLVPLEDGGSGVVSVVGAIAGVRAELAGKLDRLEQGDDGDLATRLKSLTESKRQLEERVSTMTEQFAQLVTIRKDIAGLLDKLTGAVNGSN